MKSDDLLDLIGDTPEEYIRDAKAAGKKKLSRRAKWSSAVAACLAVAIGFGCFVFPRMGGSSGGNGIEDGSTEFMSYAGPVFPLSTLGEADGITARRELTMDFAPWVPVWYSNEEHAAETVGVDSEEYDEALTQYNEWWPEGGRYRSSTDLLVTDTYTLTNTTDEDRTLTLLYPFASSLNDLSTTLPTLTVDGVEVGTQVLFGSYSGGFQEAVGSDDLDTLLNLEELTSWTAYKALLADGSYLEQTLAEPDDLSGIPAVVYAFTDASGPAATDKVPAPSLLASFTLDYEKTTVLTYGFHGGSWDRTAGTMKQGFSIPKATSPSYGRPCYLIVLGEDIANLEVKGYVNGDPEGKAKELDDCHVDVQRYETDLDTILRQCVGYLYDNNDWRYGRDLLVDFETYYALFRDHMAAYGLLSESGAVGRYDTGWLEELSEISGIQRVCYLQGELTIPAGGSVSLSASMRKPGSFDYHCAHTENQGIYGYDTVTQLGSTLSFTEQTARLVSRDVIEIVRQNFGFDLEQGIDHVTLDTDEEHYYLEVRGVEK